MTLRGKLLAAQVPLAAAIVILGLVATTSLRSLSQRTDLVLRDNYRSVLAGERMKEAIERIDSAALFSLAGQAERAAAQIEPNRARFAAELDVEEHNITEPGEGDAAQKLHAAWDDYQAELGRFRAAPSTSQYFDVLLPRFEKVKRGADVNLDLNQDAMLRKSDQAHASAAGATAVLIATAALALLAAVLASVWLTARLLRPLAVLGLAARRIGEGDLVARAQVSGSDEIAGLARDFNAMAGSLEQYRKSSLGELLLAQSAAQAVIDSLPDPVIVVGLRGELTQANQAAGTLLGAGVEKTPMVAALDATFGPVIERLAAHVLGGHGATVPRGMDDAIRVADLWFLPRAGAIYSETGAIGAVTIVLQDVTRMQRAGELKNDMVTTVAHEFRTPLTSLRMALHMCIEGAAGDLGMKALDLLTIAREDCERLQSIVDDVLDLARIQAGRIELSVRPLAPDILVHAAADAHREAARQKGLTLRAESFPGLADVRADPDRVQLVFANLVTNAIRHTTAGEITIRALAGEGAVRFEVADTGSGIAADHLGSIFERFYRVPGQGKTGAGLGLYFVKEIVVAHGGEIGVESAPGKGSTFWFTLPWAA